MHTYMHTYRHTYIHTQLQPKWDQDKDSFASLMTDLDQFDSTTESAEMIALSSPLARVAVPWLIGIICTAEDRFSCIVCMGRGLL